MTKVRRGVCTCTVHALGPAALRSMLLGSPTDYCRTLIDRSTRRQFTDYFSRLIGTRKISGSGEVSHETTFLYRRRRTQPSAAAHCASEGQEGGRIEPGIAFAIRKAELWNRHLELSTFRPRPTTTVSSVASPMQRTVPSTLTTAFMGTLLSLCSHRQCSRNCICHLLCTTRT